MERTLVLIKPDAFQRALIGRIVLRFEEKGLKLVGTKTMLLNDNILSQHYSHLYDKPFFPQIRNFMTSGPVLAMCWEGIDVVNTVRKLSGITKAREAEPGTIRGDMAMSIQTNLVHASESVEAAQKELSLFFSQDELFDYERPNQMYVYSVDERKSAI